MLGAIIGDIVGSRWEFNPTNDYNFELFSVENGFTDDTICTVAVADTILRGKEKGYFDFGTNIHEWCRRYPNPMGSYGGRFAQWVRSNNPKPYGSFGNGAAMRVSPVAFYILNAGGMLPMAEETAACTHNHPEGIKGAQTTALAIHHGIELSNSEEEITQESIQRWILNPCVKFSQYNINICKENVENKFDETCQGTVPVALWIIGQSTSFEDAIRKAVSLGADADTLGAIVGGIAEAIWGIPTRMALKALEYLPSDMKHVVLQFYSQCYHGKRNPLAGYGDEGSAVDMILEDTRQELGEDFEQFAAVMHWKLGLGNFNKVLDHESPLPSKEKIATSESWKTEPMPERDVIILQTSILVKAGDYAILQKGHIPEAMEDHWFMYCDSEYIRYYRSWTGLCAYEAHYFHASQSQQVYIDQVTINPSALMEFGVNGDKPALALFRYLLIAEVGGDSERAWQRYINEWILNYSKYSKPNQQEQVVPDMDSEESRNEFAPTEEREIEHVAPKPTVSITEEKKDKVTMPEVYYEGTKGRICEGCIYCDGIHPKVTTLNIKLSTMAGCGRLSSKSFAERYESGHCEYRKTELFVPSEFEKERKKVALQKKHVEEKERLNKYKEGKEREEKAKQDGSYAKKLIYDFVKDKLDGDINKLAAFDFGTLREDEKYGDCKGFAFSVDKCNIVKAIMSVTFADVWPELNQYNIERYKYLCNGINYTQYLFGANIMDKFFKGMEKFNPTKEQHERAVRVYHLTDHIGNIWVLPGGIDKDKDTYHYHGYADLFLKGVYAAMTGKGKVQPDLKAALYKARKLMANYKGSDGFRQLALDMMLNDYIDYYGHPIDLFMHLWSMMKELNPDTYFKAVDEYCDFMERFVPKRGKMITEKLKTIIR